MTPLTDAALADLARRCLAHGLRIQGAARHGVMLALIPQDLDALPDADALRALADALGGDGVRYVTLDLDPT